MSRSVSCSLIMFHDVSYCLSVWCFVIMPHDVSYYLTMSPIGMCVYVYVCLWSVHKIVCVLRWLLVCGRDRARWLICCWAIFQNVHISLSQFALSTCSPQIRSLQSECEDYKTEIDLLKRRIEQLRKRRDYATDSWLHIAVWMQSDTLKYCLNA